MVSMYSHAHIYYLNDIYYLHVLYYYKVVRRETRLFRYYKKKKKNYKTTNETHRFAVHKMYVYICTHTFLKLIILIKIKTFDLEISLLLFTKMNVSVSKMI